MPTGQVEATHSAARAYDSVLEGLIAPRRSMLALGWLAIFVVAGCLRFWGIGFSASTPRGRPDEELFIAQALAMFRDPNPHWYQEGFPEGFFRLTHGILLWKQAWLPSSTNLACLYSFDPLSLILPVRMLSAVLDLLALGTVGALSARLGKPRWLLGWIGGLIYATNLLAVRNAHFGVSDAAAGLMIALALLASIAAVQGHLAGLAYAAACAGFATSIKYVGLGLVFPLAAAALHTLLTRRHKPRAIGWIASMLVVAPLAFWLLSPHVLEDRAAFISGLFSHRMRFDTPTEGPSGMTFYITTGLPMVCGWLCLLFAVVGLAVAGMRRQVAPLIVGLYAIGYYVFLLGPLHVVHLRYSSPILPALAALAALGIASVAVELAARSTALRPMTVLTVLAFATIFQPASAAIATDRILARRDTRDLAAAWLVKEAPQGTISNVSDRFAAVHAMEPSAISACEHSVPADVPRSVPLVRDSRLPWHQAVSAGEVAYDALSNSVIWRYTEPEAGADFMVRASPDVPCGKGPSRSSGMPDPRCWEPVKAFSPGPDRCRAWFDPFDKFWVPAAGFADVERPGPTIEIFRNRCK